MMEIPKDVTPPDFNHLESVQLLGVRIHTLSVNALIDLIEQLIIRQNKAIVTYVNAHAMNLAHEQPSFSRFLNEADIVFCDGFGVKLGAKLLGLDIPYRYTPPDWINLLAKMSAQNNFSVFFLGALPGVTEEAATQLRERYTNLRIVGTYHGYFDKSSGNPENEAVITRINEAQPNILIVGFGMPLQEMWLRDNWQKINANVALTAGALFDYMTGLVYRAPRWITDHGFEWLARLIIEPRRLGKRYLIGNPLFLWRVLRERMKGGVGQGKLP